MGAGELFSSLRGALSVNLAFFRENASVARCSCSNPLAGEEASRRAGLCMPNGGADGCETERVRCFIESWNIYGGREILWERERGAWLCNNGSKNDKEGLLRQNQNHHEAFANPNFNFNSPTREGKKKKKKGGGGGGGGKKQQANDKAQRQRKDQGSRDKGKGQGNGKADIIELPEGGIDPEELAADMGVDPTDIIQALFTKGHMVTLNQPVQKEQAKVACEELGIDYLEDGAANKEIEEAKSRPSFPHHSSTGTQPRPPVVTVMGHVDHGKTTLLDKLRQTRIAQDEDGGITQGVGASRVQASEGEVVFIDTPGHEAFSAMRARGAKVTDIAVLVVAADDSVRPQTKEAIDHAKAAGVPLVIAVNKVDKEGAKPMNVYSDLSEAGVTVEALGGENPAVEISALRGQGVTDLLETIDLMAQVLELRADPDALASGTVIESSLDPSRGPLASLLVQDGTLRVGDPVLVGEHHGRVRAMNDDTGRRVEEAGPSMSAEIMGLSGVPQAGEVFTVEESLEGAKHKAEDEAEYRSQRAKQPPSQASLAGAAGQGREVLNLILKAGSAGAAEAVRSSLESIPQNKVALRFVTASAGDVTRSDVDLALASGAIVVAFDCQVPARVAREAKERAVEIRQYSVIYSLLDDLRNAMLGLLPAIQEEVEIGRAQVLAVFGSGKWRVAGCKVEEGQLQRGCLVRVSRQGEEVFSGELTSLRRVKDEVSIVEEGYECGLGCKQFTGWKEGDRIVALSIVNRDPSLE